MATSLVQGGPAPKFLSRSVVEYLALGLEAVTASVDEIPNSSIRDTWQKVT
jgi:hypothetical protein